MRCGAAPRRYLGGAVRLPAPARGVHVCAHHVARRDRVRRELAPAAEERGNDEADEDPDECMCGAGHSPVSTTPLPADQELRAIQKILDALQEIPHPARQRVLGYIQNRIGI